MEDSGVQDPGTLVRAACLGPLGAAVEDVQAEVSATLVGALRRGLERHRAAVEETGLDGEAPAEWGARADRLLAYRRTVSSDLLEPLADVFERSGPGRSISDRTSSALTACYDAAAKLPEQMVWPWPDDALRPGETDSVGRRIGKVFARGLSAARKAGTVREAPVRVPVLRHLRRLVVPRLDAQTTADMTRWAAWSRELDAAMAEWSEHALPALVRAELPAPESFTEAWAAVGDAARTLGARLETLVEAVPEDAPRWIPGRASDPTRRALDADLAVAGSFLLSRSHNGVEPALLGRTTSAAPAFVEWDLAVAGRMRASLALLACLSAATAVQMRLIWRFREHCAASVEAFPLIATELDGIASRLAPPATGTSVADSLLEAKGQVEAALAPALESVPDGRAVSSMVAASADSAVETLMAMVRQAPTSLTVLDVDARPRADMRRFDKREVRLHELARQAFNALLIERVRGCSAGLEQAVEQHREDVRALPDVFSFAYEAATRELEEGGEGAEERAAELVREAVSSIAESLRQEVSDLDAGIAGVHGRLANEVSGGSLGLLDRVSAAGVQARLLAARSRAADVWAGVRERWAPRIGRAWSRIGRVWRRLRGLLRRGLRIGSEMVSGPTERAASARAIKELSEPELVTDRLPLVYQRLFTMDALSETGLLVGREGEIGDAMARWRRWQSEDGVPLVVKGRHGCGISSFLSALCERIAEAGGSVARVTLEERVGDEAELARRLAEVLELPTGGSLTRLGAEAFATERGALPDALVVDNLEHLYLRVPGGTDLIERLLTLMSETEPRIFWIAGVTTSAWQVVAATEPAAISQVDVMELPPLGAARLREGILARHRRSGLPITYEEPSTGRVVLRRRLRRMQDPERYRRLLEDAFFEQLDRGSAGHVRLAVYLWLRSADFGNDGVLMRTPEKPDFSVLESLDLTQNFTLKAFLEHRTLTLDEHDRIFRVERQVSYQIFESLANRHLIRAVDRDPLARPDRSEVEDDLRYEIQPLLAGAVLAHLATRNIVH